MKSSSTSWDNVHIATQFLLDAWWCTWSLAIFLPIAGSTSLLSVAPTSHHYEGNKVEGMSWWTSIPVDVTSGYMHPVSYSSPSKEDFYWDASSIHSEIRVRKGDNTSNMDTASVSIKSLSSLAARVTPSSTTETGVEDATETRRLGSDSVTDTTPTTWTGECGLWLAPSTLQGAGLGMYAGRNFEQNEALQVTGDVVIPIVDLLEHALPRLRIHASAYSRVWDDYTWNGNIFGMHWEGHVQVSALSPGMGAAINSFLPLVNVDEDSDVAVDAASLHRSRDPGAGAFTPYHNRRTMATTDIFTGQELFIDYGDRWFDSREHFETIPLHDDLDEASKLVRALHQLEKQNISHNVLYEAWNTFVSNSVYTQSRVFGAFHHDNPHELETLKNKDLKQLRVQQSTRSLQWLQQHGTCADHLQEWPSTFRQAGRGAIAARHLPTGTIVAHVPLLPIKNRAILNMYTPAVGSFGKSKIQYKKYIGQQLLLNYCYGHNESSLLLCPYGAMASLINHNQTQANVRLQWADQWRSNHVPELLTHPLKELERYGNSAKLAMDIVAIRDVRAGDEIFLDYGDAWEVAWQHHVQTWQPPLRQYTSASEWNANTARIRTEFEQLQDPYPVNIELRCNPDFEGKEIWQSLMDEDNEYELLTDYYPCEVLQYTQVDDEVYYTVVLHIANNDNIITTNHEGNHIMENVPRLAIRFVDVPYSTDMFFSNAFRHSISIPDDIFPLAWRNLRVS
jgi:hypothetical protein